MDPRAAIELTTSQRAEIAAALRRFRPYPSYKDSGVEWLEEIPTHWQVKRLRFVSHVNPSKSEISPAERHHEVSFLPMECIGEGGILKLEEVRSLMDVYEGFTYFRDGDVLVAKITPCFENGKGALAFGLTNGIGFGTTELHVIRPNSEIDPKFLWYLSVSFPFRAVGETEMKGTAGQKRIAEDFIRDFRLPLLPVEEQRTIATFLDRETARIDGLIAKKKRLIELLQEKRTALITQAVTKGLPSTGSGQAPGSGQATSNVPMKDSGVEWLGEIPTHWEVKPLKFAVVSKAGAIKTGPFGSQLLSSEMEAGEVKVYNQRNVIDGDFQAGENYISTDKYKELIAFTVEMEDVLLTTRGTIGKCTVVPKGAEIGILHPCLMRIQPDASRILPAYLSLLIQDSTLVQTQLLLASNATTIDVIYSDTIKDVRIPLPPISEQRQIIGHIEKTVIKVDSLIAKIREAIERLKEYRTALISAAVTGKIDVREAAA